MTAAQDNGAGEVVQLDSRRPTLGGSTLPAAAGIDPWCSPQRLWHELRTGTGRDESEAMRLGKKLEVVIFAEVEEHGYHYEPPCPDTFRDDARPWLVGHPDGFVIVNGTDAVLEAKTVGTWAHQSNGAAPPHYIAQVQTYLHLTGLDRWMIAALVGGSRLEIHEGERDQWSIDMLLELGERFMEHVRADTLPPVTGHPDEPAALREIYPEHELGKHARADKATLAAVRELRKVREQAKAVKAREHRLAATVTAYMGDAEVLIGSHDEQLATWRTVTSRRVNTKKLQADYPIVYEAVADSTTTRRLTLA